MSRVLLCGAFGQDNPGDDALLAAFRHALRDHELVVATDGAVSTGDASVSPRGGAVARVLGEVDAVVVAGGTIFKSLHRAVPRHHLGLLLRTRALVAAAHAHGVPVAMVGVGAGELRSRTAARLSRSIVDAVDLLVVRDEESASVLRRTGAGGPFRIGADPAWTLPGLLDQHGAPGGDHVLVALSHLAGDDGAELAGRVAAMVDPLLRSGVPVRLQPWQAGGADDRLATQIRDLVAGDAVDVAPRPRTLEAAVNDARACRAVIGLRHHALVAAGAAGRPFLALSHEPKLAGLARRLDQTWAPPHASAAVLGRAAQELLSAAPPARRAIIHEVEVAGRAMDLLRVVVSGGSDDTLLDRERLALSSEGSPW